MGQPAYPPGWQTPTPTATPAATPTPVGTGVSVPAASNIDPNAGRPQNAYGTVGEPAPSTNTGNPNAQIQNPPVVSNPATANAPVPALTDLPAQATAILQDSTNQLAAAQGDVARIWDQIQQQQGVVAKLQAGGIAADPSGVKLQQATSQLNSLYSTLSAAEQRVETANVAKSNAAQKVLDSVQLTPDQAKVLQAQQASYTANAEQAHQQAVNLDPSSPMGAAARDKLAADAAQSSAQARLSDALASKAPAEAAFLQAQANQITTLLPGLSAKQDAETKQIEATTGKTVAETDLTRANRVATEAQGRLYDAQAGLVGAQATQLTPAEAANQQSQAELNRAKIQQAQQGPAYGLQDQISAIKAIQQQVFGSAPPGADLDQLHQQATDLLNQYISSTIGGTTPYAASVAAQNAQQNIFQTQAAMSNQASQAAASRANAYMGAGGSVLATLAGMNANAPAGSTAMAGAFQDVMRQMAQQTGQGQFAAPTQPTAPALPSFLQRFAGGTQGSQTTAPVTINIGGQPQQMQTAPPPLPTPNPAALTPPGGYAQNQPGTYGQLSGAMPAYLAGQQAPTMDFVHQLWGKELGSGAVTA